MTLLPVCLKIIIHKGANGKSSFAFLHSAFQANGYNSMKSFTFFSVGVHLFFRIIYMCSHFLSFFVFEFLNLKMLFQDIAEIRLL